MAEKEKTAKSATQNPAKMSPGDQAVAGTPGTREDICPVCSGSGRIGSRSCPNCEGTGRVTKGIGGA